MYPISKDCLCKATIKRNKNVSTIFTGALVKKNIEKAKKKGNKQFKQQQQQKLLLELETEKNWKERWLLLRRKKIKLEFATRLKAKNARLCIRKFA